MSLKRSARSPTSSSRSRRMTRPRSPWVTSSMASTRRLSGLEIDARVDSHTSHASSIDSAISAQTTVRRDSTSARVASSSSRNSSIAETTRSWLSHTGSMIA